MCEESSRKSFAFSNFRLGRITGWRRCFNQNNWVNVHHGDGSLSSGHTAALSMIPAPGFDSTVALLDVSEGGMRSFYEREDGYKIVAVPFAEDSPDSDERRHGEALVCTACQDDDEANALWTRGGDMEALPSL